jgi:aminopeptidase N
MSQDNSSAAAAAAASAAAAAAANANANAKGRIPLVLQPVHYDLWYQHFCLSKFRFDGVVTIRCRRLQEKPFQSVAVHAADLQLTKAEIRVVQSSDLNGEAPSPGGALSRAVEFRHKVKDQVCEIQFDRPIEEIPTSDDGDDQGESSPVFLLTIHFTGCLNDQMRGLYRSSYESLDSTKEKKWILTTQMEPTDARRAFPCFDEPALKATFCITCTVPFEMQCLSNTPIRSSHTYKTASSQLVKTVAFQTTPKMSTYLVALIVGQFDSISQSGATTQQQSTASETSNVVTTTVYTVPGKAHQAEFCLDTAAKCLDLFQNLFQIPYPLAKSDLVAIPDFAAGYVRAQRYSSAWS